MNPGDVVERALGYHERTKHHLHRYARSLGYMDWANQPDPFRTYQGAPRVELPLGADGVGTAYDDLYAPGAVSPAPLDLRSVGILFELGLGISAWKEFQGTRWALRCDPSSGNLHPTEGYAIVAGIENLPAGVHHYVSRDHVLERRAAFDGAAATLLPPGTLLVGLSSIHWREAWKYGERAFRYCQHDAGHVIASIRYAAGALGWTARLVDSLADEELAALLGIDRDADWAGADPRDREHPDALLIVGPPGSADPGGLGRIAGVARAATWAGTPNVLSAEHADWPIIDDVAQATIRSRAAAEVENPSIEAPAPAPLVRRTGIAAARLIRQRRSCQALDGRTTVPAEVVWGILDRLLPRPGVLPWDALSWPPHVHPVLFVHRVEGLAAGLYLLERSAEVHDRLRGAMSDAFEWVRPEGCPEHLRFFRLAVADLRSIATTVSCHQDIAGDGVFSVSMVADFIESVRARGAWWYRRLFWEAGMLGHVLYLEAEAAGIRGTGIGCYFDDAVHELLGLTDRRFQSLYHFTMGGPVDDPRLTTLPAYANR